MTLSSENYVKQRHTHGTALILNFGLMPQHITIYPKFMKLNHPKIQVIFAGHPNQKMQPGSFSVGLALTSIKLAPAREKPVTTHTFVDSVRGNTQQLCVPNAIKHNSPDLQIRTGELNPKEEGQYLLKSVPQTEGSSLSASAIHTPIKVSPFYDLVSGFNFDKYLISGFRNGFRLGYIGPRGYRTCHNLPSCAENPSVIDTKIKKEIVSGRVKGPFPIKPFEKIQISPIGCVPKKSPGDFRIIHHLSYPKGSSINDFICDELSTTRYASLDDAAKLLLDLGPNSLMAKTDIESAFRLIPIHPFDHELLGFKWRDMFYYDTCLPFGASSSCAIFERFSSSLEWIAHTKLNIPYMTHILDDFLILGSANSDKCLNDLNNFLHCCAKIGVPINKDKTELPTTCIVFMGIELDSATMEARLPLEKLVKARTLLNKYKKSRKITLKELQSLLGYLNFCCSVVRPGRCFLRRLIDLSCKVKRSYHLITLGVDGRRDLQAWSTFIDNFNGKSLLLNKKFASAQSLHLHTDAAGSLGYGAIFGSCWFYGSWPNKYASFNITFKELFPIVLALGIWGFKLANKCITIHSDNEAVVYILNKQTSKDKAIMTLVRRFVILCMNHNILIRSEHIPGKQNVLPDLLSRFQIKQFNAMAPNMDTKPTPIPRDLLDSL